MTSLPFISVLLPVRNEEKSIEECLSAILSQDYPSSSFEVIVADGDSTDHTREIIHGLQKFHANLHLIANPGKIVPTGLNAALYCAKGEVIVRVDGHTIIAPDYVKQCVLALQTSGADNVGGRMRAQGTTTFGKAVALATSSPFGVGGGRFHYSDQEEWVDTVYLGAWRREVFSRIGLFDEEMVRDQDDEFNYRLREHGGKILLSPSIKSVYTVRGTPRALWKQYFQYGFWKIRVLQKHTAQMRARQFVPPLFVGALIVSFILPVIVSWGWVLLAAVVGSYLLANICSAVITARGESPRFVPLLSVCFLILHVSYGAGFLTGLAKFIRRWKDKKGKVPELRLPDAARF